MARISRYLILGLLGGFLGWAAIEPFDFLTPHGNPDMGYSQIVLLGGIVGLFIGTSLGAAEALSGVAPRDAMKSVLVGALVGAGGGALGLAIGNSVYQSFLRLAGDPLAPGLPPNVPVAAGPPKFISFLLILVGRSVGWALIGVFIGLAQGLATQSTRKMINGAVGGFIGGGIGGFFFQILDYVNGFRAFAVPVELMRLAGITLTAGAIGLFIGFIEEITKQAWLVHLRGRNEGKEFTIFKPETVVGRDELVDVPVFGDPDVEPRHFVIKADQRRHVLQDLNTFAGTSVNGQKVQQQLLKDGDIIQIGMTRLLFRDKATRSLVERQPGDYAPASRIPTSEHICPYCGSIKDAGGNCACTVGAGAAPSPNATASCDSTVAQAPQPGASQTMPAGVPLGGTSPAGPRLVGISGPYSGQTFELLADGETTIGRQSDRHISLPTDATVSRQHARVTNEGGQDVIYDMGSSNGTYVNNARITRHVLIPGDLVQIGSTKFRYER